MTRLYYLTHTIDSVSKLVEDLHRDGVTDWNIHVLSKDEAGLYHHHIHGANMLHKRDIIHSGEQGALIGLVIGTVCALLSHTLLSLPTLVPVLFAFTIVLFGAWSGGLVGVTRENYRIQRFRDQLEKGFFVVMIDVHRARESWIKQRINHHHPEASLAAQDSTLIQPFSLSFWSTPKKI